MHFFFVKRTQYPRTDIALADVGYWPYRNTPHTIQTTIKHHFSRKHQKSEIIYESYKKNSTEINKKTRIRRPHTNTTMTEVKNKTRIRRPHANRTITEIKNETHIRRPHANRMITEIKKQNMYSPPPHEYDDNQINKKKHNPRPHANTKSRCPCKDDENTVRNCTATRILRYSSARFLTTKSFLRWPNGTTAERSCVVYHWNLHSPPRDLFPL